MAKACVWTAAGILNWLATTTNSEFHISFLEAMGRRLRRNYSFMFGVQAVSYIAKICIHPDSDPIARRLVATCCDWSDTGPNCA